MSERLSPQPEIEGEQQRKGIFRSADKIPPVITAFVISQESVEDPGEIHEVIGAFAETYRNNPHLSPLYSDGKD